MYIFINMYIFYTLYIYKNNHRVCTETMRAMAISNNDLHCNNTNNIKIRESGRY